MLKNINVMKLLAIYSVIMLFVVLVSPFGETKAIDSDPVIDISTSPAKRVFEVSNIKPGDTMTRPLVIQNDGNIDFDYNMASKMISGSDKLFNQLLLSVSQAGEVLYSGTFGNFEGMSLRSLGVNDKEELSLSVEFPYESGNEFQGLATSVLFTFTAEGKPSDGGPGTDSPDGDQGTAEPSEPDASPVSGQLPQTGESAPTMFYVIGGLLMLGGATLGVVSYRRRRME